MKNRELNIDALLDELNSFQSVHTKVPSYYGGRMSLAPTPPKYHTLIPGIYNTEPHLSSKSYGLLNNGSQLHQEVRRRETMKGIGANRHLMAPPPNPLAQAGLNLLAPGGPLFPSGSAAGTFRQPSAPSQDNPINSILLSRVQA